MSEPELWAALAIAPIDADAIRARDEVWDVSRRSLRLGMVVVRADLPHRAADLPVRMLRAAADRRAADRHRRPLRRLPGDRPRRRDRAELRPHRPGDEAARAAGHRAPRGRLRDARADACRASTTGCAAGPTVLSAWPSVTVRRGGHGAATRRRTRTPGSRARSRRRARPAHRHGFAGASSKLGRGRAAAPRGSSSPRKKGEPARLALRPLARRAARRAADVRPRRAESAESITPMAAIELSGVVKSFGPITAVDGLDLDVPEGICLGLLGPNGAGKSTTMRLLTGQAIADSGELRVLGHELPRRIEAGAGGDGRRPPARQPRRRRHRRGQPRRLRPPLPGQGRRRRGRPRRSTWPACATAAATPSTSSPAACAGACCWPAASSTSRAWSCSTSRPSASTRRSAPSSGP